MVMDVRHARIQAWWRRAVRPASAETPWTLEEELALAQQHGIRLVTLEDSDYPAPLAALPQPPPVLYVRGQWLPEDAAAVAVVGSRACSTHGQMTAERLAHDLAAHGLTIVSGLARGIDAAAHRGALRAGGRTIAVLGSGLLRMFPPEHAALAETIAGQGAVVSEFPLRTEPFAYNFPRRNRVIAGLALGTVVVEAAARSGALITATHTLEQGKEVFAVPGPAGTPTSRGTHALLRDGARLVESAEDLLQDLKDPLARCLQTFASSARDAGEPLRRPHEATGRPALEIPVVGPRLTADERAVYARLSARPVGVDQLTAQTSVGAAQLLPLLLGLELKGLVRQAPGQQFVRVAP